MVRRSSLLSFGAQREGFTLIELLTVISIIALLIAILLPALSKVRQSAEQVKCLSNVKQMTLGILSYAQDFRDRIPFFFKQGDSMTLLRPYIPSMEMYVCPSALESGTNGANHPTPWVFDYLFTDIGLKYTDYKLQDNWGIMHTNVGNMRFPTWTVTVIDIDQFPVERHGSGENLGFVDGHAAYWDREDYHDPATAKSDPLGRSPWWRWGEPQ